MIQVFRKTDLSAYNIDMWYAGIIFFENGECGFTAENDLGTKFLITIDKSDRVLSEVKISKDRRRGKTWLT